MRRPARILSVLALAAALCAASAGPATAAGKKNFKAVLAEATAAFKAEDYAGALEAYRQAYALKADPSLLFMVARAQEELGDREAALETFRRCLAAGPPAEVAGRTKEKIRILEELLSKGRLLLLVATAGAEATVDGQSVGVAPFAPLDLPPGNHRVRVFKPGYTDHEEDIVVPGGGEATLRVALVKGAGHTADVPAPAGDGAGDTVSVTASPGGKRGLSPWNWILVGTGGALLAAGTGVFVKGYLDHQAVDEQKRDNPRYTYAEARDLQNAGNLEKTVGIALLGAGGAALVTGIVLIFVPKREAAAASEPAARFDLAPMLGGATVGLEGSF